MKEVKDQIMFYKQHRRVFQYGTFWRGEHYKANKVVWHCSTQGGGAKQSNEATQGIGAAKDDDPSPCAGVTGFFQTQATASEGFDRLRIPGLDPALKYRVTTRGQRLFMKRFGGLVKHILPVSLDPDGFILRLLNRHYSISDNVESYTAYGKTLADGLMLNNQFMGTHYNENTRLLGDFGSNLYLVQRVQNADTAI